MFHLPEEDGGGEDTDEDLQERVGDVRTLLKHISSVLISVADPAIYFFDFLVRPNFNMWGKIKIIMLNFPNFVASGFS